MIQQHSDSSDFVGNAASLCAYVEINTHKICLQTDKSRIIKIINAFATVISTWQGI